jgi:hypothetical protein
MPVPGRLRENQTAIGNWLRQGWAPCNSSAYNAVCDKDQLFDVVCPYIVSHCLVYALAVCPAIAQMVDSLGMMLRFAIHQGILKLRFSVAEIMRIGVMILPIRQF